MSTTIDSQDTAAPPVRDLGSVALRNGERLVIRLISPPACRATAATPLAAPATP